MRERVEKVGIDPIAATKHALEVPKTACLTVDLG
jgi:hypothetical protein